MQEEEKQLQDKLEALINSNKAEIIHKGDLSTIIEVTEQVQNAVTGNYLMCFTSQIYISIMLSCF